jgi:ubiquinone/menaquinone biosynthesis C-methylase UbiE
MDKNFYKNYSTFESKHWWSLGRRQILVHLLFRYLKSKSVFLDIGCGIGMWMKEWEDRSTIFGIDKYYPFLEKCRSNNLEKVICGLMQRLPFKNNSFDCITLLDVLEHVDDENIVLKEIQRIAKPNAVVLITVPALSFLWGNQDIINHHKRRYTIGQINSLMQNHGFLIKKISYYNTILFPVIFAIRTFRRLILFQSKSVRDLKSDFEIFNSFGNRLLKNIFSVERYILQYFDLPIGVSIICIACNVKQN